MLFSSVIRLQREKQFNYNKNKMNKFHKARWVFVLLLILFLFSSCATTEGVKKLDPESEEFLSQVRYIITREESKIFRELPPGSRRAFIEEFWERRDPTPETERNEFKDSYFQRIEEANRFFKGARPGWLQDRGHIYILFGPPNERQTNPMGGRPIDPYEDPRAMIQSQRVATGEKPTEVWIYYNFFSSLQQPHAVKIVFVDTHGTGDYQLSTNLDEVIPGGIDSLLRPNIHFTHELYKEEAARSKLILQRALFDFSWEFIREKNKSLGSNLLIRLVLPFKKIIFEVHEGRVEANLALEIKILDETEKVLWHYEKDFPLAFREEFLEKNREALWEQKIPVLFWLEKGKYSIYIRLKNESGDQEVEKLLPLRM